MICLRSPNEPGPVMVIKHSGPWLVQYQLSPARGNCSTFSYSICSEPKEYIYCRLKVDGDGVGLHICTPTVINLVWMWSGLKWPREVVRTALALKTHTLLFRTLLLNGLRYKKQNKESIYFQRQEFAGSSVHEAYEYFKKSCSHADAPTLNDPHQGWVWSYYCWC